MKKVDNDLRRFAFISNQLEDSIIKSLAKEAIVKVSNIHRRGNKKDIFVFSGRRSGSTWLMDILYSQPKMKFCAEPLYLKRWNRHKTKLPRRENSKFIDLTKKEEIILKSYFNAILNGSIQVSPPWNIREKGYSFFTNRYVIKICNGLSLINWFEENFDVYIVYSVRHPISNALSIINLTWKDTAGAFLNNRFFVENYLDDSQLKYAKNIKKNGSRLQKFVLEWTLENLIPLHTIKKEKKNWIVLTYEEMVLNPEKIVGLICNKLNLEDEEVMLESINKPSRTATMKSAKHIDEKNIGFILKRWKEKVSDKEEKEVFEILKVFEIDIYKYGGFIPNSSFLNFPEDIKRKQL
jgi:hypothetical protein